MGDVGDAGEQDGKKEASTFWKNIVFVNDKSTGSFVKAPVDDDNVFKECLMNRKRQHKRRNIKQKNAKTDKDTTGKPVLSSTNEGKPNLCHECSL